MKKAAVVKITNGQARAYNDRGECFGTVGRSYETAGASMTPNGDIAINMKNGTTKVYDGNNLIEKFTIYR